MKRKVVQHGPSTLTVSLPAKWVREQGIGKGTEVTMETRMDGLYLTARGTTPHEPKRIDVSGVHKVIPKAIAALYKCGYDDVILKYSRPEELERIHDWIQRGGIGFEIIDETKSTVHVRKVSDLAAEEFRPLFRRLFHFLTNTAADSYDAAAERDHVASHNLLLRDDNINKLADFCRRIVNKQQQTDYHTSTALYHVIEELEKIGDSYKRLNKHLEREDVALNHATLAYFADVNRLLSDYQDLFFKFTLEKGEAFYTRSEELAEQPLQNISASNEQPVIYLKSIVNSLSDLLGTTMMLEL